MKTQILLCIILFASIPLWAQNKETQNNQFQINKPREISQKRPNMEVTTFRLPGLSNKQIKMDIQRNENISVAIKATTQKTQRKLLLNNLPAFATVVGNSSFNRNTNEQAGVNTFTPFKVSLFASLASLNFLKQQTKLNVEIQHFNKQGELIKSEKLSGSFNKRTLSFEGQAEMVENGYIILSIDNISKTPVFVTSSSLTMLKSEPLESNINVDSLSNLGSGDGPVTNSEAPAWENDLEGVTILGHTDNGDFLFNSPSQELSIGSADDWQAIGIEGNGSTGGYGGDGSDGPTPGPEEKKIARDLNAIKANPCETRFLFDHFSDYPGLSITMYLIQKKVENYLDANNMGIGNTNGAVPQNAFKHAYLAALTVCATDPTTALSLLAMHEMCDGVDQNPPGEMAMDTYNNGIGSTLATSANCANENSLLNAVWYQYVNQGLHNFAGQPTTGNPAP